MNNETADLHLVEFDDFVLGNNRTMICLHL